MAPTSPAAPGPSRTAAASVADELGDHLVCLDVSGARAESQTRNSACRTPSASHSAANAKLARGHRSPVLRAPGRRIRHHSRLSVTRRRDSRPAPALLGQRLAALDLGPHCGDPSQDLGAKLIRRLFLPAAAVHEPLHELLQTVLPQARPALVQVLADLPGARVLHLAVDVGVDQGEHLCTRHFVRLSAAHGASFRPASPSAGAVPLPAGVAAYKPWSAA